MDVSSMLSNTAPDLPAAADTPKSNHQYPTRHAALTHEQPTFAKPYHPSTQKHIRGNGSIGSAGGFNRSSPLKKNQKHVVFQLIDHEDPRIQARLPMRVMISTHDTTESIITTVKNFYGLYEDYGVSFENKDGAGIIAAYDNFENDMIVYVRTVAQKIRLPNEHVRDSASPHKPTLGAPIEMRPSQYTQTNSPSRFGARSVGARSVSPQSDVGQRSASAAPGGKSRSHRMKSKDNSVYGDGEGYSSGDNGGGSVASSRRSKQEVVNAEISVDNIVEGGRRKRAFESSELPLFVPPQVPMTTSISSISPQRRAGPPSAISPYPYSNQQTFSYTQPLPSPQSYGSGAHNLHSSTSANSYNGGYVPQTRPLRGRPGAGYSASRQSVSGILPTPDPTVGSAISDEDVALQLMRLGDPMAFSHGRTSTSTVDDAMSGKAEAASSEDEEDEDDEEESDLPLVPQYSKGDSAPPRKKQRLMNEQSSDATSSEEYEDRRDGNFLGSDHVNGEYDSQRKNSKTKLKQRNSLTGGFNSGKPRSNSLAKPKSKPTSLPKSRMSPSSMPAPSRNPSVGSMINFQHQFGTDEEDLSSKPRCQRCRKSKKGCDRQRPCGRCKDAGIGIEGCISEDEGNGRKGRYGRHMGVSVKRAEEAFTIEPTAPQITAPANGYFLAPAIPDKSKKRKR